MTPLDPDRLRGIIEYLRRGEPWMKEAECQKRGLTPDDFVLARGASPRPGKEACAACTVGIQCEDYAARTGSVGIWNGKVRLPVPEPLPTQVQDARPYPVVASVTTGVVEVTAVPVLIAARSPSSAEPQAAIG